MSEECWHILHVRAWQLLKILPSGNKYLSVSICFPSPFVYAVRGISAQRSDWRLPVEWSLSAICDIIHKIICCAKCYFSHWGVPNWTQKWRNHLSGPTGHILVKAVPGLAFPMAQLHRVLFWPFIFPSCWEKDKIRSHLFPSSSSPVKILNHISCDTSPSGRTSNDWTPLLSLTVLPIFHPITHSFTQTLLGLNDILGNSEKSCKGGGAQHPLLLPHPQNKQDNQVGQGWFALGKSVLDVPNHLLVYLMPEHTSPWTEVKLTTLFSLLEKWYRVHLFFSIRTTFEHYDLSKRLEWGLQLMLSISFSLLGWWYGLMNL